MNETEKRIIQLIDEHREELITMGNELYTRAERAPPPEKRAVSMWL